MGDNGNGSRSRGFTNQLTLTRRDFLKTTAVATAAGGLLDVAAATPAFGVPNPATGQVANTSITTCLCCSVGCGQLVDTDASGNVLDIYGDPNHVVNAAANCPKGAAALLNATGDRRLGIAANATVLGLDDSNGGTGPWYRTGSGAWTEVSGATDEIKWSNAMGDIATRMLAARNAYNSGTVPTTAAPAVSNNGVAFLGCSHATNEENYLYRKIIANFGSSNTEHQARI